MEEHCPLHKTTHADGLILPETVKFEALCRVHNATAVKDGNADDEPASAGSSPPASLSTSNALVSDRFPCLIRGPLIVVYLFRLCVSTTM